MIHEIGREIEAKLRSKGCPFKVVDREEFKRTAWTSGLVVIEETGDTYAPPTSQSRNPKRYADAKVGAKVSVYAKSAKSGAMEFEHRRLARAVVDMVVVALRYIRGERRQHIAIGSGSWGEIEDLAGSDRKGGVVYELAITVDRGVAERTFAGAIQAQANIVTIAMTGAPSLTFAAAGSVVTRSAGSWIGDGFAAGLTIRVGGSASNNVTGAIATVAALTITLTATALTDEGPIAECTVEAGGIASVTHVFESEDDTSPEIACGA